MALKALRKLRIVHGDIKPHNVLVSPSGHLALADFDRSFVNISNDMHEQRCIYEDVSLEMQSGTLAYVAPEVLRRGLWQPDWQAARETVTPRADLWSLGMTLLEFALAAARPGEVSVKLHIE